jgi:predicted transcriptional regulator YdeE
MSYIYGTWLPGSGRRRRNAPDVEVYGPKFDKDSDASELEICIPIQ